MDGRLKGACLLAATLALAACEGDAAAPSTSSAAPSSARPATKIAAKPVPRQVPADIERILAPLRDKLEATRRPVARITLESMASDDPFASKVGGVPYLERGDVLPKTPDGAAMVLLAQVNFAEVPQMPGYPREGLLQWFIPADHDTYGVDYSVEPLAEDGLAKQKLFRLRWIPAPLAAGDALADVAVPHARGNTPHDPTRPRRMRFAAGTETISSSDGSFERVTGIDHWTFVEEAAETLGVEENETDKLLFGQGEGHKLGGYPYFTQEDPRVHGSRRMLLLQLDSDDEMLWGDVGVGSLFIDPEDLARGDFSRVVYTWDCT